MALDPQKLVLGDGVTPVPAIAEDPFQRQLDVLHGIATKLSSFDYANAGNAQQVWEEALKPAPQTSTDRFYARKMARLGQQATRNPIQREGFRMQGRIMAGGTGDTPIRNDQGNITGYKTADRNSTGGSGTPGLDRLEQMQREPLIPLTSVSGIKYSWESGSPTAPIGGIQQPEKPLQIPSAGALLANDPARFKPAQPTAGYAANVNTFNSQLYQPADTRTAPVPSVVRPATPPAPNLAGILSRYQTPGTTASLSPEQLPRLGGQGFTPAYTPEKLISAIF